MSYPRVYADLHNADAEGRLRLNCIGTVEDLARQQVTLQDGIHLALYSEDLEVEGEVLYSSEEHLWVAAIDWDAIVEVEGEDDSAGDSFVEYRKTAQEESVARLRRRRRRALPPLRGEAFVEP